MTIPHFYEHADGLYHPTGLARSPWDRGAQNGVALGGLVALLVEGVPSPGPMNVARLTIDILAAAPFGPLEPRTSIIRDGRRIQMVQSELVADGRAVARATALRVRDTETPAYGEGVSGDARAQDWRGPEGIAPMSLMGDAAFGGTLESRLVSGGLRVPGPSVLWVRFGHEHVAGVPLSPLVRTAMLGDFGGGLGSVLDKDEWTYANLDISIHMLREPRGEWLLLDAATASEGRGVGRSDMILADTQGPFARAHQMLFIAPRG